MPCTARQLAILVPGLVLLFGASAGDALGQTVEQPDLPNERVRVLIQLLDNGDFTARTRAEVELSRAGLSSISMIETAARRDPENAARLVGVLERLMVGGADANNGRQWARSACVPTADAVLTILRVGDFSVTETAAAAERSLERLAEQNSVVAGYAVAALSRHRVLRENRAIQELRQLGAKIVFQFEPEFLEYDIPDLEGLDRAEPQTLFPPPMHQVDQVYILSDWKGGTEKLSLLNHLRVHDHSQFVVYAIEGSGITEDDVRASAGEIPGLHTQVRGSAAMGFSSSSSIDGGRCVISGLVEGLSAQRAGLNRGDEIIAIDGRSIDRSFNRLIERLKDYHRGDVVSVSVIRSGMPEEVDKVDVTLSGWEDISDIAPQIWGR
jgi:hypothetical protein